MRTAKLVRWLQTHTVSFSVLCFTLQPRFDQEPLYFVLKTQNIRVTSSISSFYNRVCDSETKSTVLKMIRCDIISFVIKIQVMWRLKVLAWDVFIDCRLPPETSVLYVIISRHMNIYFNLCLLGITAEATRWDYLLFSSYVWTKENQRFAQIYTRLSQLIEGYSVFFISLTFKGIKRQTGEWNTLVDVFSFQTDISHVNHILKSHLVVKFQNTQEGMSELLVICKPWHC